MTADKKVPGAEARAASPSGGGAERARAQMELSFGGGSPRIAGFPHLIVASEPKAMATVLRTLGEPAGIFGNRWPRVDRAGEPFVPPESDERILDDFVLFDLPKNQQQVEEWCLGQDSIPIAWLIPAATPVEQLRAMHTPWIDWQDYRFYIDRLADWLDELPWAMVPLEHEGEFVLVVFGPGSAERAEGVEAALVADGFDPFRLRREARGWSWPGPIQRIVPG